MLRARLYLDYIDPGSFIMDRRVRGLEEDVGSLVERCSFEVRPPPQSLLDPEGPAWTGYWEEMADAARDEGLELHRPGLVPWSRKAHELALHAREAGCFAEVHQALFRAFHLEGRDLGRVDVLVEIARTAGMDHSETKAVLDVDRHAEALERIRREAGEDGVAGVPTMTMDGRLLEGIHPPETVKAFLEGRREEA